MPKLPKFFIGLGATLAAGWISHGPLGRGDAFVSELEAGLQAVLADANVATVSGRVQREPLARTALLSGTADQFQREGLGSLPGIDERALSVPGMGRVRWTDQ